MNYSKKHLKHIAYRDSALNKDFGFEWWYAQTVRDFVEAARYDPCFRNQKKIHRW